MRYRKQIWLSLGALLAVALAGCSGKPQGPPRFPVTGKVTLDGKPLANTMILFIPTGQTRGHGGLTKTDENGQYKLFCRKGLEPGVPVGTYRVAMPMVVSDEPVEGGVVTSQAIPTKYSSPSQTILKAKVAEEDNTIDFALASGL